MQLKVLCWDDIEMSDVRLAWRSFGFVPASCVSCFCCWLWGWRRISFMVFLFFLKMCCRKHLLALRLKSWLFLISLLAACATVRACVCAALCFWRWRVTWRSRLRSVPWIPPFWWWRFWGIYWSDQGIFYSIQTSGGHCPACAQSCSTSFTHCSVISASVFLDIKVRGCNIQGGPKSKPFTKLAIIPSH